MPEEQTKEEPPIEVLIEAAYKITDLAGRRLGEEIDAIVLDNEENIDLYASRCMALGMLSSAMQTYLKIFELSGYTPSLSVVTIARPIVPHPGKPTNRGIN